MRSNRNGAAPGARTATSFAATAGLMVALTVSASPALDLPEQLHPGYQSTQRVETPVRDVLDRGPAVAADGLPLWLDSYSQAYPGCVPLVLWPVQETPVALVTRGIDGVTHRVGWDTLSASGALDAQAIGACRG